MTVPTHAISIRQPWLELMLRGEKTVEFRSWPVAGGYLGRPIALAATKGLEPAWNYLLHYKASDPPPPRGAILAIAIIAYQFSFSLPLDAASSNLAREPGLPITRCDTDNRWWAWKLSAIAPIDPIPCRGAQRIWRLPEPIRAQLADALRVAA